MNKKVLYAAIKYPYANPDLGLSYEYYNFLDSLKQIKGLEVKEFDWVKLSRSLGKREMNRKLLEKVERFKPDFVFFSIFREEFGYETIKKIAGKTIAYNWFSDDSARFESYIKNWAGCFTCVSTATESLIPKYKKAGFSKVIHSRWGVNAGIYKEIKLKRTIDISFVGQAHSNRRRAIHELQKNGLDVYVRGRGWIGGVLTQAEMVRVFNRSKINLNLTSTHFSFPYGRFLPWFLQPKDTGVTAITSRICEITACDGFLLTQSAPEINNYFKPDKEMVVFENLAEMVEKVRYYLEHDKDREKVALAGHKRAQKDHTYVKRFTDILKTIGIL